MGTVLSSPRDGASGFNGSGVGGSGWSQQLRTSKSTFSLKTDRAAAAAAASATSGQSAGIFRAGLPSSISFRNLSIGQASFGRRKDKAVVGLQQQQQQLPPPPQPSKQPQTLSQQQLLPPSIATISNWSNDSGVQQHQPHHHHHNHHHNHGSHHLHQQQLQLPAAPCKSQQSRSGLTKSTSCYAFKASAGATSAGTTTSAAAADTPEGDKENRSGASDSRRLLVQASTSDLLKCVAAYLSQHCSVLSCDAGSVVSWIRSVDRNLILQGWADMAFVNPPNLVFLYLLVKAAVPADISSERQLQATLLTCLYVAYSYMGNEISYPLKPFLVDGNRAAFWERCISLANQRSGDMLRLNSDPSFFIEVFTELRSYA